MGSQIIKQPSGKYAVWSSIVDSFIWYDGTREEIKNAYVYDGHGGSKEDIEQHVDKVINALDEGGKPYYQFTQSWDEALAWMFCVNRSSSCDSDLMGFIRNYKSISPVDVECVINPESEFWKHVAAFYRDSRSDLFTYKHPEDLERETKWVDGEMDRKNETIKMVKELMVERQKEVGVNG